jgi:aromatic ring-opening dioxygenase catalytic subunit (LigB family)
MASSHALALNEPAAWDKMRETTRARFKARYGKEAPVHPKVAEEPIEIRQKRYQRLTEGYNFFRKMLMETRPDALILIGDDQDEQFNDHNLPQIAIYVGGDFFTTTREADGKRRPATRHRCHSALAQELLEGLVEREFDVAMIRSFPQDQLLAHAHAQILNYFHPESAIPVVPIFVNAIHFPALSPGRGYRLGQAIKEIVERRPTEERSVLYASGGLSHFTASFPWRFYDGPFTLGCISEEFDRRAINCMAQGQGEELARLSSRDLLENGDTEMISWLVLLGAVGRVPARVFGYEPLYSGLTGMAVAYWDMEGSAAAERAHQERARL